MMLIHYVPEVLGFCTEFMWLFVRGDFVFNTCCNETSSKLVLYIFCPKLLQTVRCLVTIASKYKTRKVQHEI
jgi:hypothetical protein